MIDDPDTPLARALFAERRHDVAALQALLAEARAGRAGGGPGLAELLVARGLLSPAEVAARLQALGLPHGPQGDASPAAPPSGAGGARTTGRRGATGGGSEPGGQGAPEQIGGWVLGERLGAGGMGTVYRAVHAGTGMPAALKLFPGGEPRLVERFRREGEAQARVDAHPNVARVHAAGEEDGRLWIAMELCPGGDLAARLERGPLEPAVAARIVADLARGMAHAHARGVLHRDLKPANVLFDAQGVPKLVDFGLARLAGEGTITKTGAVLGTPAYMAPEQAKGEGHHADERADVYGLGALLYHCLTGRTPFQGVGVAMLVQVLREPPPSLRRLAPHVPPELEAVCLRALAKRPEDRWQTALELALALERPPPVASRRRLVVGGLGGLALVLLAAAAAGAAALGAREETAHAAARLIAAEDAAALAAVASAAAWTAAPLADDGGTPAALRSERERILAALAAVDPRASAPPALDPVEPVALALEGLVALARGDPAGAAQVRARLAPLPADLAAVGSDAALALGAALAGGLDALTPAGAPDRALEALAAAGRAGVARPELGRWRDQATWRLVLDALQRGQVPRASELVRGDVAVGPPDESLGAQVLEQARRTARGLLSALEQVPAHEAAGSRPADALGLLCDLILLLAPGRPPLEGHDRALLERFAFDHLAKIADLAAYVAEGAPDDLELQRRAARHGAQANWVAVDEGGKRELSLRYLAVVERARAGAPAPERVGLTLQRAELLVRAGRFAEAIAQAEDVLAEGDLAPADRALAHHWRGLAVFMRGGSKASLADFDRSIELDPTNFMSYYRRCRARWNAGDAKGALDDADTFCRGVDGRIAGWPRNVYPYAAMMAWRCAVRVKRAASARPALERHIEYFGNVSHAGWRLRLAHCQAADGDERAARATLRGALDLVRKNGRIADLAAQVERAAAGRGDARALVRALQPVVDALDDRRPFNAFLP